MRQPKMTRVLGADVQIGDEIGSYDRWPVTRVLDSKGAVVGPKGERRWLIPDVEYNVHRPARSR